jgi:hypothetical protein
MLRQVLVSLVGAALWLFIAGLLAWGNYSTGVARYAALVLALPIRVANAIGVPEPTTLWAAFAITFLFLFAILRGASLLRAKHIG